MPPPTPPPPARQRTVAVATRALLHSYWPTLISWAGPDGFAEFACKGYLGYEHNILHKLLCSLLSGQGCLLFTGVKSKFNISYLRRHPCLRLRFVRCPHLFIPRLLYCETRARAKATLSLPCVRHVFYGNVRVRSS
jgi:hypothetical protein